MGVVLVFAAPVLLEGAEQAAMRFAKGRTLKAAGEGKTLRKSCTGVPRSVGALRR
jgi:hypothetical protein